MNNLRTNNRSLAGWRGFTLVEVMLVVVIVGMLASLAVPMFYKVRLKSQASAFMAEVRVITGVIEQFAMERGYYPPDGIAALHPVISEYGMKAFATESVIGGRWDWDRGQFGVRAALSLHVGGAQYDGMRDHLHRVMEVVDKTWDDGNLATGRFRQRAQGYMFILQE